MANETSLNLEMWDDLQINILLQNIIQEIQKRNPNTDIIFLTLPKKDSEKRKEIVNRLLTMFEKTEST